MLNPEKLVEDLFDDKNLSDAKLRAFTEDHLMRMTLPENNPGGIYLMPISDTTTKYTAFFGKMNNEMAKKAISEGLTITTNNTRHAALAFLTKLQNLVKYQFGETSATYQEFYPLGMSEYHDANLDDLKPKFARFITAASTHLSVNYPMDVTELIDKVNAFENARQAQQTAFAEVDNLKTGRREDRKALTLQLTFNMLTIATYNLENPDNYNNYYNPSYLPLTDKAFSVNGVIAAGAIESTVAEGVITQSSNITVYNKGTEELIFSLSNNDNSINPEHQITVAPGNNYHYNSGLPVLEQYFLNVYNPHPTEMGKWRVVIH